MGILRIPHTPQYGVIIEQTYGENNSLFHEVYKGAAKNVSDIINGQNNNEMFKNPCIAFVGKRGTGKSSAMISFSNFLHNIHNKDCGWIQDTNIRNNLINSSFYALPPIDSANMGKTETIVADISASMYSEFNESKENIPIEKKRDFLELAKKTNDSAILKNFGKTSEQGDQLLIETNKIVNIKKTFENLVEKFLEIINCNSNTKRNFLVIQIDDLDMNVSDAFVIMEEIRNILSVKNVIILLSVDIKQFKSVFKIHFEKSLDKSSNNTDDTEITTRDLSYKYIEKLLPEERRHHMPELTTEQLLLHTSQNFLGDNDESWNKISLKKNSTDESAPNVMYAVMHLIWRKTMIIPMRNEYGDYILLPHNLRSLCNFIVFLRGMKDAAYDNDNTEQKPLTYFDFAHPIKGEKYRNILDYNLRLFNKYLISNLETCEMPKMNTEDSKITKILLTLIETLSDLYVSELNSKLVGDIIREFKEKDSKYYLNWFDNGDELDVLFNATRYKDTISMGDVMYVLGKIDKKTRCGYIRYLIQVIRTIWSIKMTREIFVIGCNSANSKFYGSKTKYITRYFRDTVGAMFINPDTSKVFYWDDKKSQNDWTASNKQVSTEQFIYDLVIPKNDCITIKEDKSLHINKWRVHLLTGAPVYRSHFESTQNYCLSHPMSIFSNLLNPSLTESWLEEKDKKFSKWQEIFIMAFPFYSMDYMFRLYEKYIERIRTKPFGNIDSVMSYVLDCMLYATLKLQNETKYYIPNVETPNQEEFEKLPFLPNTNKAKILEGNYMFDVPIHTLINIEDWDNHLVLVNMSLVDELEKISKSISADDNAEVLLNSNFFFEFWRKINPLIPDRIKLKYGYSLESPDNSFDIMEKLNTLLRIVKGEEGIVPFYYYNKSAIIDLPDITKYENNMEGFN